MAANTQRPPFGQNLYTLRKAAGLTQGDLAKQLGLDRSSYAYYETGVSLPNFENLKRLADIFGVTTDYLLGRRRPHQTVTVVRDSTPLHDGADAARSLSLLPTDERDVLMWYRQLSEEEKAQVVEKLGQHCLNRD